MTTMNGVDDHQMHKDQDNHLHISNEHWSKYDGDGSYKLRDQLTGNSYKHTDNHAQLKLQFAARGLSSGVSEYIVVLCVWVSERVYLHVVHWLGIIYYVLTWQ